MSNVPTLTYQQFQHIHTLLTQRKDSLSKKYSNVFHLRKENILDLYHRLTENFTQYEVVSKTDNITVFQSDKVKKEFKNIKYFEQSNILLKETQQIVMEFNFVINAKNINEQQTYKITIIFLSDFIMQRELKDIPFEIQGLLETNNARFTIEYFDYLVAKTFLGIFDEWLDDLSETKKENHFLKYIEFYSKFIRYSIIFSTYLLIVSYLLPKFISTNNDLLSIQLIFVSLGTVHLIHYFSNFIFRKILMYSFGMKKISFIELTETDKQSIQKYKSEKRFKWLFFIATVILNITYGVIASYIFVEYIN